MNPSISPSPARPRTVEVALGPRSYEIHIGHNLLAEAGRLISAALGPAKVAIVTDANVAPKHLDRLKAGLGAVPLLGEVLVPPGEPSKGFHELERVTGALLAIGVERRDAVLALGGGVIGDLAGFAAAILRRGVRLVQVPTSLLAQVDSSVGGKTGINTAHGKNLVGAFHQPALVLADLGVLATLPRRELAAGYAEVAKYGLLGDARFFEWLEANAANVLSLEPEALAEAVETSCRMKAGIVARDETETGERMLLNLGHTFAHALEAWAGFSDRLLHGEAVAIGTCLAFALSEELGHAPKGVVAARVRRHFASAGLPTSIVDIPGRGQGRPKADDLMRLMAQDKKVAAGRLTLILARAIGDTFITREVDALRIRRFWIDSGAAE
ncbi:MAG: 3-dehydroquinate synthase [Hyphomicrobiaceae bacterium]|nr:MAG: 3-dehydroquinate synthase [Hyphomicrobiaceae bacterium]